MDVCIWDWDVASKYIPLVIAGGVYLLWHKQKGKEVIANEAKQYMYYLNKLQSLQIEIHSTYRNLLINNRTLNRLMVDPVLEALINEYKSIKSQMSNSGNFLYFALNEDRYFSNLSSTYLAQCLIYIKNLDGVLKNNEALDSNQIPDAHNALEINRYLVEHALYKRKWKWISKILAKIKSINR